MMTTASILKFSNITRGIYIKITPPLKHCGSVCGSESQPLQLYTFSYTIHNTES